MQELLLRLRSWLESADLDLQRLETLLSRGHTGEPAAHRSVFHWLDYWDKHFARAVDLWALDESSPPPRTGLPASDHLPDRIETEFGLVAATHQNLNDGTLEGLACREVNAFSVQYHPEAAPGPNDAATLFDRFANAVGA